jgi:hypothetical protein
MSGDRSRRSPLSPLFEARTDVPAPFVEQFMLSPEDDHEVVLEGIMEQIWFPWLLTPLYRLLGAIGMLVPHTGRAVPCTLHVVPRRLADGTPVHEWNRTFGFETPLAFDTTIVWDLRHNNLADLVGRPRMLRMVWDARFQPPGTFTLRSIANAVTIGDRNVWLPRWLWRLLLGTVDFVQTADPTDADRVHVDLRIRHAFGVTVFRYRGWFRARRVPKHSPRQTPQVLTRA